uniref:Uncharacterized protein n=1 Tax=Pinctada fucata TaxID=50426 RepID=A0A194AP45_PINFU
MGFLDNAAFFIVIPLFWMSWSTDAAPSCSGCTYKDTCYELGQLFNEGCLVRQCVKRKRDDNLYHFVAIKKFSCEEGDDCHDWKSRWNVTSPGRYCALKECKWWRKPGDWPYSFGSKNKIIEAFCIDDENECHPIDEEEASPFMRTIGDKVYNECYCKEVNKELLTTCKS